MKPGLHVVAWLLVLGLTLPLFLRPEAHSPYLHVLVGLVLMVGFYYFNTEWLVPKVFERGYPVRYLTLVLLVGGGFVALRVGIEQWAFNNELVSVFPSMFRYRIYTAALFSTAATVGFLLQLLHARRAADLRAQELLRHQQESQLLHLRAQINPHFLFNTLNNIYVLSLNGSKQAPDAVLRLAGLLRYAIYSTRYPTVAVADEIAQIEQLLDLYRLRFATPPALRLTVKVPAASLGRLEPMLLIPLVENCLKHSDLGQHPAAFVHLTLDVETVSNSLLFVTENTYEPHDHAKDDTPGVGLANIRRRLALTYPSGAADLSTFLHSVSSTDAHPAAQMFRAELRLPLAPPTSSASPAAVADMAAPPALEPPDLAYAPLTSLPEPS